MAERGVAVHVLAHKVQGDELEDAEKDMFRTCASYGEALGSSLEGDISKDAVHDLFVELATRPGKLRFTSRIRLKPRAAEHRAAAHECNPRSTSLGESTVMSTLALSPDAACGRSKGPPERISRRFRHAICLHDRKRSGA